MRSIFLILATALFSGQVVADDYNFRETQYYITSTETTRLFDGGYLIEQNTVQVGSGSLYYDQEIDQCMIITADHVVSTPGAITTFFDRDGKSRLAKNIISHPEIDLALLIIEECDKDQSIALDEEVLIGNQINVFSHPENIATLSSGSFVHFVDGRGVVQDEQIKSGSSGAGVFNSSGDYIGMVVTTLCTCQGFPVGSYSFLPSGVIQGAINDSKRFLAQNLVQK